MQSSPAESAPKGRQKAKRRSPSRIRAAIEDLYATEQTAHIRFDEPPGDPGLMGPDSAAWKVLANPISVFVGGVAAAVIQMGEASIRAGVLEHSDFDSDPLGRVKRTGMAAFIMNYGPSDAAEEWKHRVKRIHAEVRGEDENGRRYSAFDADLMELVMTTTAYCFYTAYQRYVRPSASGAFAQRYYTEVRANTDYFGRFDMAGSAAGVDDYIAGLRGTLSYHSYPGEVLDTFNKVPVLHRAFMPVQRLMVRAAAELIPAWVRDELRLPCKPLSRIERGVLRAMAFAARYVPTNSPPEQACRRMGLSRHALR